MTDEPGVNVPWLGENVATPLLEVVHVAFPFDRAVSDKVNEQVQDGEAYGQVADGDATSPGAPTVPGETTRWVRSAGPDADPGSPTARKAVSIVNPSVAPMAAAVGILQSATVDPQQMAAP